MRDQHLITAATLEQWHILASVERHGGIQAAADVLGKSQSTVSYALQRLQQALGVSLFKQGGRRAELNEVGHTVLRRALHLLEQARALEAASRDLAQGWEPELRIAADGIFPPAVLNAALAGFAPLSRGTRLDIFATTLSGTDDMIIGQRVDLALTSEPPIGFLGEPILEIEFIAVAAPHHPLFSDASGGVIDDQSLRRHRQIVVRDSGVRRRSNAGWLGAEQRWTVSGFQQSIELLVSGVGFAFVPRHLIASRLASGALCALPLATANSRRVGCQLLLPLREDTGPAAHLLAGQLRDRAKQWRHGGVNG